MKISTDVLQFNESYRNGAKRLTVYPVYGLTKRESEVVLQIALGKTNDEVAVLLGITPATVKLHMRSARLKLGANNSIFLISRCFMLGILRTVSG